MNFLEDEDFKLIKNEFDRAITDERYVKKTTQLEDFTDNGIDYLTLDIDETIKDDYPNLFNILNNSTVINYFQNSEKKNPKIFARLERIKVVDSKKKDPNKDYHFDTFHNTFKSWLFIKDVSINDGPFYFIPSSHKFSMKRFLMEWKMSIQYSLKNIETSFRTDKSKDKNLDEKAVKFAVNKNTFVMANTHALHRRGDADDNTTRDSIQFWTRENPFKIIFN